MERKLLVPLFAGLVFAAVVAGFTLMKPVKKTETQNASKTMVFSRQLIGRNQFVGDIKGVMKTALATDKDGGRVTVSRGKNSLEFAIPIANPTLNSQSVGILQATDVAFASKDKLISARYNLIPDGIKEEIIMNKIPQENTLALMMKTENLQIKLNPDGIPVFYDSSGVYQFHFERPYVKDGAGVVSYGVRYRFVNQDNKDTELFKKNYGKDTKQKTLGGNVSLPVDQYTLLIDIDSDWLHDPKRVLPIIIDPTVVHNTTAEFSAGDFNRSYPDGSQNTGAPATELTGDANTIGLYHFNETADGGCSGSEDACDSSGNGNHGTATGTTINTSTQALGAAARSFNGTGDSIALANEASFDFERTSTFSIEAWVKTSATQLQTIVSKLDSNAPYSGYEFWIEGPSGRLRAYLSNDFTGGNAINITGSTPVNDGDWHHVSLTYSGSSTAAGLKLYVDGVEDTKGVYADNLTATMLNNITVQIGSRNNAAYFFMGSIDEVQITNDVRSAGEIATDAARGPAIASYYQELPADEYTVGLWHMNEASGNILDSSGNNITGTPTGTTVVDGRFGNGRNFNGTSDYISMGDVTNFDGATSLTIQAWIKPDTLPDASTYNAIVTKADYAAAGNAFALRMNGTEGIRFLIRDSGGIQINCDTAVLPPGNTWTLVTAVLTSTDSCYVYYNGVEKVTASNTSFTSIQNTTTLLKIGSSDYATEGHFDGTIDEVQISQVERTPEEIKMAAQRRPYSTYTSDVIDLLRVASWNSLTWTELGVTTGDGETLKNTTGLITQWNFNETSGTTAANNAGSCSTSCDGTLTGFDSTASQDADPDSSWTANNRRWGAGALQFDGIDSYVTFGQDIDFTDQLSGEIWVNFKETDAQQIFFRAGDVSKNEFQLQMQGTSNNRLFRIRVDNASTYVLVDSTVSAIPGKWYYIAWTYDGALVKLYVDGQLVNTGSLTGDVYDSNTPGTLGATVSGGVPSYLLKGTVDSVRIYNRPLTAAEILSNHNSSQLEFQTRVGDSTNPDDGTWEAWNPTTSETQIDDFDSNTDSDGIDTIYLGDTGTNQTWIKKNNVIPAASNTTSTDGRIPIGTSGRADVLYAYTPWVIKDSSTYKMWYSGHDGTNVRILYATSSDGLSWTKNDNTIETPSDTTGTNGRIPLGTAGKGDSNYTVYPSVIKDGSTYKMWYTGHDGTNNRIFYATSSDGLTWTKYDNTIEAPSDTTGTNGRIPLGTAGKGDASGTLAPSVIKDGGIYKMWYSGLNTNWRIYYATSSDGLTWTKYDNTIPTASDNVSTNGRVPLGVSGIDTSHAYTGRVLKDGNVYKMWYGMHNGTNVRAGYAISNDGLTWAKYRNLNQGVSDTVGNFGRIPLGSAGRGDVTHTFSPSVIKDDGVYKVWYQGYDGTASYRIYHASMTPLPLKQELDANIKMEGTASERITTGIYKNDAGVKALWHLDETGGTGAYIKDLSGGGFNGTPSGTAVADGIAGKARNFNGTSDYISMGDQSIVDGATDITVEAWLYSTTSDVAHHRVFSEQVVLYVGQYSNQVSFYMGDGAAWVNSSVAMGTLSANQWHHVAWVKDGTTGSVYIDGVLSTTMAAPATLGTTAGTNFIGGSGASQVFGGNIDEVRISRTARTAEEVAEAYRMGRGHYVNKTISSTDLSSKTTLPYYVAADRPGTYLQATVGESAYANYQPDANTMGLWHLEEVSGASLGLKDASVFGNYMTSSSSTITQGKIGQGRYFNGSTYGTVTVNAGNSLDINSNPVTLEAWIKPNDVATLQTIVARGTAGTNGYGLHINTTGKINLGRQGGGNVDGATTLIAGQWYHVVGIINGTSSAIYLNGQLDYYNGATDIYVTSSTGALNVGANSGGTVQFFNGVIDEVRISNVVRTAEEIRQAYEVGARSHSITIDFAADLDSGNLIANSSDVSFTVDATAYGLNSKGSKLYPGDKIIVRENYDGTEYIAQGTVSSVNESTGATTVVSWDAGSTFPSSGYSVNASVFKWQREYWNITEPLDGHVNAVTNLSLRLLDGNEGRTVWIDDLSSGGDYLTTPSGSTITSSTGKRYFQYRVVQHSSDENVSASLTSATLDYVQNSPPNTPSLDSPTDTQTNRSLTPSLQTTTTDTNSDNLQYKIELCEDLAMTSNCQTFDQTSSQTGWSGQNADGNTTYTSGTQATYTVQAPLVAATTYYWRSYAIDPGGINTWSSTQGTPYSFTITTAPSAPLTPYAEGATNPTGVTDTTPEFSAVVSDPDGDSANYYRIQVNTQSDFLGTSMWDSTKQSMTTTANGVRSPDISYAGTAIPLDGAGTTYYWRIKFWDVNGAEGSYTTAQSFTMNVTPGTPTLDAPTDTATSQSVQASLKTTATDTNSDNLKYKIELCTNATMTLNCQTFDQTISQTGWSGQNADTNTTYTSGTQATYNIQSALSPATTYYWRSYAIDPSGSNTWSATQGTPYSFTTTSTDYPTQCRIEKSVNNNSLIVKWNDNSTNEINYEIQKNTDGGGFSLLQTLAANSISHQDNSVSNGHTYQYRVAAIFSGPQYSQWCITSTVSLGLGKLHLEGVNLE